MNRIGFDPTVKKTLVRNCEKKVTSKTRKEVVRDVEECSSGSVREESSKTLQKYSILSEPSLCSSAALANYLADVKKSMPPPVSSQDLNVDKGELCSKMTKKLNFHFNDKIYKNLIELNTSIEEIKSRKEKRPQPQIAAKKDMEPDIADFCEDEKETDFPPKINVVKPKFKPIRTVEDGRLHRLVASFECL